MKLQFISDQFELRTPVQQLLDRFLIGYPHRGAFHKPDCQITLVMPEKNALVERRMKDYGLHWQPEASGAEATLVFNRSQRAANFVYGAPLEPVRCVSGTAVRGAWLLPEIAPPKSVAKAVMIVQGAYPMAEMEALDALLPLIWKSQTKILEVVQLRDSGFWQTLKRDYWPLVKSAMSRSDSPQGDPVRDGRTQDLVGLGLLEELVKSPRGWLVELQDGMQFVIAVMDGAIADYNVALQTRAGGIVSAQVYRPPAPAEHHYSRLAAMLEHCFRRGETPWPIEQSVFTAEFLKRCGQPVNSTPATSNKL